MKRVAMSAREDVDESSQRPRAIIIGYKKVKEHPRINRIATTLAESGRDVMILGLTDADEEEFVVGPHVRGVGLARFRFRIFLLRHLFRPLDALQRSIDRLRWR